MPAGDARLLERVNGAILDLYRDGTLERIYRQYGVWSAEQATIGTWTDSGEAANPVTRPAGGFARWNVYLPILLRAAVTTVCTFPFALAVPAAHPAQDFAGLVAWLRAQSAEVPFASPATGSAPHFLGIMLGQAVGARLTHVPYRGAVPAIQDLLGGRLPMFVGVLGDVSPHIGNGVRMLALSSPARHPRHPSVPTFAELGHPALNKQEWFAAFLPAGTPAAIVAALHAAYRAAAASPELVAALDRLDFTPGISESPAAFAAQVLQERTEWAEIVKASGFRPEA
jgi:tripartite-type tricarboxylate transporter receptor subunit TctC